jgi:hypothetical protein
MLDANGSKKVGKEAVRQMRKAGCTLWFFHTGSLRNLGVHSVQGAFGENWAGETGELFVGDDVFPELKPAGDVLLHAVFAKPENSAPAVKILHHTAICLARKRIHAALDGLAEGLDRVGLGDEIDLHRRACAARRPARAYAFLYFPSRAQRSGPLRLFIEVARELATEEP